LWAESYEHDLRDVLQLQAEVAAAIAKEVQVKLTPQEEVQFAETRSVDPEAYEAYLRGRYYWTSRSRDGHGRAVQNFRQAITKDPTYAPAYAGLADSLSILGLWGLLPPDQGCGKAKDFALRAVEIDSTLPEGHTSLGWSILHYDYDFSAAEREFEKSIQLNARYATTRQWYGMFLAIVGRFEQARTELRHATRLDPCSGVIRWAKGFVEWRARQYDQAIREYEEALELDANFAQAHWGLGIAYLENKMYERAISQMEKTRQVSNDAPVAVVVHGEACAAAGYPDEAQRILDRLPEFSSQGYVMPYFVGRICAALGKSTEALQWLETGFRDHAEWMVLLKTDARFDDLYSSPRFQDLLHRMNFPS
jgi:tetratricopeptide (TPR) repeat protein